MPRAPQRAQCSAMSAVDAHHRGSRHNVRFRPRLGRGTAETRRANCRGGVNVGRGASGLIADHNLITRRVPRELGSAATRTTSAASAAAYSAWTRRPRPAQRRSTRASSLVSPQPCRAEAVPYPRNSVAQARPLSTSPPGRLSSRSAPKVDSAELHRAPDGPGPRQSTNGRASDPREQSGRRRPGPGWTRRTQRAH